MTRKKWVEPELREVASLPDSSLSTQCIPGGSLGGPGCFPGMADAPMGCVPGSGDPTFCSSGAGFGGPV